MTLLILPAVAGHTIPPLTNLAPDVLHRGLESSLEQQTPKPLYRVKSAGGLVETDLLVASDPSCDVILSADSVTVPGSGIRPGVRVWDNWRIGGST